MLEAGERLAAISVAGIAPAFESRFDGDGGHREASALCGGHAGVHVLYALVAVHGAAGVQVYLQVGDGLQHGLDLQVFHGVGRGRGADAVVVEQPASFVGLVDIAVTCHAECKVKPRRHHTATRALAEHVAHVGQEAGQRHGVGVAVAYAHVAHHHEEAGGSLQVGEPWLFFQFGLGHDVDAQLHGVQVEDADFVVTDTFHGTVLSMALNKQFAVAAYKEKVFRIIEQFELLDRNIDCQTDISDIYRKLIDYNAVNDKIRKFRKQSLDFIASCLSL